jgi:hypothetical protein
MTDMVFPPHGVWRPTDEYHCDSDRHYLGRQGDELPERPRVGRTIKEELIKSVLKLYNLSTPWGKKKTSHFTCLLYFIFI